MARVWTTIGLLILSNIFMTFAWYGHLKDLRDRPWLVAALVLGLVNAFVRPVLVFLTLPVTILTLGLFIFFINAFLFWFVTEIVKGFTVTGFMAAMIGSLMFSVISLATNWLVFDREKKKKS